ncbi:hypothetical protein PVAG01_04601 [Phlyctema vagabunda]|uniref:SRP9 domain-containing protein n=1 Tax=Phlyctema vagabunda TaxID=108571 RepID=A0ABR4PHN6_9HELO
MPYLETAQSWLTQSTLLLRVHPTTVPRPPQTRITTKYNIAHSDTSPHLSERAKKRRATARPSGAVAAAAGSTEGDSGTATNPTAATIPATPAPAPIRATLTLKTYDSVSGASLKYSTTKAAEVSRLIQILGRLARPMAGVPEIKDEGGEGAEAGDAAAGGSVSTPVLPGDQKLAAVPVQSQSQGGGGGGGAQGKKGKKKGKK